MAEEAGNGRRNFRPLLALIVAVAVFATFSVSLSGEFVYDDTRQIVRNTLIQEPSLYWQAMTSDVWAFKGDGNVTASNYWRPTFTAWSIFLYRLFSLDPFGWHLANLLLHSLVSVLAFLLLSRWGFKPLAAFAAALVFAVHPVHTESVAWIAGAPDLLFSALLLGALLIVRGYDAANGRLRLFAALGLYALALGSKEVAMLCFPLFGLAFYRDQEADGGDPSMRTAVTFAAPFFGLAAGFFALRWIVLGSMNREIAGAPSFGEAILTAPSVLFFYIKQAVLPLELAANYGLRPVESAGIQDLVLPLAAVSAFALIIWRLLKWSPAPKLALGLLVLPILPALNITAFMPEQIVHDRYFYLPLLGLLAGVIPAAEYLFEKLFKPNGSPVFVTAVVVVSLVIAVKSFTYARVWNNDVSIWEHAVEVDPQSASNFIQYGAALEARERFQEADRAYERSLAVAPRALGYLGSGRVNIRLGKYDRAIQDLRTLTQLPTESVDAYTLYQAYEALAIALTVAGDAEGAAKVLEEASERLPIYRAALTAKLAVVYYQQGRKEEALQALESVRERARTELLPESKSAIFRLGALYAEIGRRDEAVKALNEYLQLTASFADENTLADKKQASEILAGLR
ncbi:MAG TPA: tetratricopeptide repeat protein [Aridibacter sp.]|nr:tetratricopeptide repeat protein [Aridibacter sp.]